MDAVIHSDAQAQQSAERSGSKPGDPGAGQAPAAWSRTRRRGLGARVSALGSGVRDFFCVTVDALYGRYDR